MPVGGGAMGKGMLKDWQGPGVGRGRRGGWTGERGGREGEMAAGRGEDKGKGEKKG